MAGPRSSVDKHGRGRQPSTSLPIEDSFRSLGTQEGSGAACACRDAPARIIDDGYALVVEQFGHRGGYLDQRLSLNIDRSSIWREQLSQFWRGRRDSIVLAQAILWIRVAIKRPIEEDAVSISRRWNDDRSQVPNGLADGTQPCFENLLIQALIRGNQGAAKNRHAAQRDLHDSLSLRRSFRLSRVLVPCQFIPDGSKDRAAAVCIRVLSFAAGAIRDCVPPP
jgi:hypothetical protein